METIQRMRTVPSGEEKKRSKHGSRKKKSTRKDKTLQSIKGSENLPGSAALLMASKKVSMPSTPLSAKGKGQKLCFESPRLEKTDSQLFPATNSSNGADPTKQWQSVTEQAGQHQQDGSVLFLRPSINSPQVLKCGVTTQAAARVKELHAKVTGNNMPEWMDAIANKFPNLEHLHLAQRTDEERENEVRKSVRTTRVSSILESVSEDLDEEEIRLAAEHSDRLKRLYILYRIPDLISIDGARVTTEERRLAKPNDPNGHKVDANEWVQRHKEGEDIRISLPEGEECVEIDVLATPTARKPAPYEKKRQEELQKATLELETHREKLVEVDLTGKMIEHTLPTTPRFTKKSIHSEPQPEASLASDSDQEPQYIVDNTSVVTTDVACGLTACGFSLWSRKPEIPAEAKAKNNMHRSSSWKDCRKMVNSLSSRDRSRRNRGSEPLRLLPRVHEAPVMEAYRSSGKSARASKSSKSERQALAGNPKHQAAGESYVCPVGNADSCKEETSSSIAVVNETSGERRSSKSEKADDAPVPIAFPKKLKSNPSLDSTCSELKKALSAPPPPPPTTCASNDSACMETIDSIECSFSKSSSPTSLSSTTKEKGTLPPACPGKSSREKMKPIVESQKQIKRKKKKQERLAKWKEQQSARSTSIMDEEDDEDLEEETGP